VNLTTAGCSQPAFLFGLSGQWTRGPLYLTHMACLADMALNTIIPVFLIFDQDQQTVVYSKNGKYGT
jgi:hypothetical protein